jgi:hypothetical protein
MDFHKINLASIFQSSKTEETTSSASELNRAVKHKNY